jgi:hypothetical protein
MPLISRKTSMDKIPMRLLPSIKTTFKAMLFYLVMVAVILTGCPTESGDDGSGNSNGGGRVTIRIRNGVGNARTIQPPATELAGYRLTFSGGPAHDPVNIASGNNSASVTLL